MTLSIKKANKYLFLIGLFFIPFNSFEGVNFLGEFRKESAAYFFLVGFLLSIASVIIKKKLSFPFKNSLIQIILVFVLWCFLTTVLNIDTVYSNYFKQTSGLNRFIRQYGSLLISSIFFLFFYWSVLSKMSLKYILYIVRKVFTFSLIFASIYGFIETLIIVFGLQQFRSIINIFNYFPFLEVRLIGDRISSVSYEPPFLAIYLITISGWMFSYIITSKGCIKFIPTVLVLLLTYFSGSRTALAVVSLQVLIFLGFLFLNKRYVKYAVIFFTTILFAGAIIIVINPKKIISSVEEKIDSLNFKSNLTESVSNKSRIGMQYASLQVAKQHPIIGVGFGQQAYHNRFEYPVWATKNNYEFTLFYKNESLKSFPPGYDLYVRILTETGIIGLSIFLFLLLMVFYSSIKIFRNTKTESKTLAIILIISFAGLSVNFLQIDTFRLYGFWICIIILILLIQNYNNSIIQEVSS